MRDWLIKARTAKGFTMLQMAEQMGITESYYCLIEQGKRQERLDLPTAQQLSRLLDVSMEDIIQAEG